MITEILTKKRELIRELEKSINNNERIKTIRRDAHAKRYPIGCGMTIHTGFNCPFSCSYCYITEMGFEFKPTTPYPLTGKELVLALLYNSTFVPGRLGTFLALGSVVDPFYPTISEKTLDFIKAVSSYLKNPIQFSTKSYLSQDLAEAIKFAGSETTISPLITIITISFAQQIEAQAPKPTLRFQTIENMRNAGLKPFTFIRPIIPGITDIESLTILEESKFHGAIGIVAGTLRINKTIMKRLMNTGINLKELKKRIKAPLTEKQIPIDAQDIKQKILADAQKLGLLAYNSACCANAFIAGVPCFGLCYFTKRCMNCPNDCIHKLPKVDIDEIQNYVAQYRNL